MEAPSDEDEAPRAWIAAVVLLFAVTHFASDRARVLLGSHAPVIRALAFVGLIVVVMVPFARGVREVAQVPEVRAIARRSLALSAMVWPIVAMLVIPRRGNDGYVSLARQYARFSLAPFVEPSTWFHKRLLWPALASLAPHTALAFWCLALAVSFFGVFALVMLVESRIDDPSRPLMRLPLHLALATANPVIFAFESPGYPDLLALAPLWIAFALPLGGRARAAALAFGLLAHESALFAGVPLVLALLPTRERRASLIVAASYAALWALAAIGQNAAYARQIDTDHLASWRWLLAEPWRAALGVFYAYKLLWLVVAFVVARAPRELARATLLVVLVPLALLPVAVDTSRVVGFGVAGVALACAWAWSRMPRATLAVASLSLLVPSVYVGLNTGEAIFSGCYAVLRTGDMFVFMD